MSCDARVDTPGSISRRLTVAIVASGYIPRIEDAGIERPDPRVSIPDLEGQRILHFVRQTSEIERHEPLHRILFTHPIYELADALPFPDTRSTRSARDEVRPRTGGDLQLLIGSGDQRGIRILVEAQVREAPNDSVPQGRGVCSKRRDRDRELREGHFVQGIRRRFEQRSGVEIVIELSLKELRTGQDGRQRLSVFVR